MSRFPENSKAFDRAVEILESGAVKPTRQRLAIARVLFVCHQHLSADQVMLAANRGGAELSKATVYNTLKLFVEKRLIREVTVDPDKVFYDSNTTPHHHLYDVQTGEIIDIDAAEITVAGLPPLPEGKVAEGVDVIVRIRGS
jgi:Fur family transcriptional regulator, iron response regulator